MVCWSAPAPSAMDCSKRVHVDEEHLGGVVGRRDDVLERLGVAQVPAGEQLPAVVGRGPDRDQAAGAVRPEDLGELGVAAPELVEDRLDVRGVALHDGADRDLRTVAALTSAS